LKGKDYLQAIPILKRDVVKKSPYWDRLARNWVLRDVSRSFSLIARYTIFELAPLLRPGMRFKRDLCKSLTLNWGWRGSFRLYYSPIRLSLSLPSSRSKTIQEWPDLGIWGVKVEKVEENCRSLSITINSYAFPYSSQTPSARPAK